MSTPLKMVTKANKVGNNNAKPKIAKMVVGCWVRWAMEEAMVNPMPMAELPAINANKSSEKEEG